MASLTLLLPELRRIAVSDASPLYRWLSRGDERPPSRSGRDVALRECFEFLGTAFPHAALVRSLYSSDAAGALWLNADPAYVIADAVTVRMLACGSLALTTEESNELAKPLKLLFGDAGFPLEISPAGRWQLRCPKDSRLPAFAVPSRVLGDDLARHLPSGENERQWRHLLNEAQVILHNHPVNAARVKEGKAPANSVWFWGAGVLPAWVRTKFSRVTTNDEVTVALAKLSESAEIARSLDLGKIRPDGEVLLDAGENPGPQIDVYVSEVEKALQSKRIRQLTVASSDGSRHRYKPAHGWRFWRPIRPTPSQ